jgi:hypothetical protein
LARETLSIRMSRTCSGSGALPPSPRHLTHWAGSMAASEVCRTGGRSTKAPEPRAAATHRMAASSRSCPPFSCCWRKAQKCRGFRGRAPEINSPPALLEAPAGGCVKREAAATGGRVTRYPLLVGRSEAGGRRSSLVARMQETVGRAHPTAVARSAGLGSPFVCDLRNLGSSVSATDTPEAVVQGEFCRIEASGLKRERGARLCDGPGCA